MMFSRTRLTAPILTAGLLTAAVAAPTARLAAQERGIHVRSVRVLATDPEALAAFYMKAFGMSETRRAANSATWMSTPSSTSLNRSKVSSVARKKPPVLTSRAI